MSERTGSAVVIMGLLIAPIVLIAVLAIRTAHFDSKQLKPTVHAKVHISEDSVARLSQGLRFRTTSATLNDTDTRTEFEAFHRYLQRSFTAFHKLVERERFDYSVLYTWRGTDASLPPVLVSAHLDVVPEDLETRGEWKYLAFSGALEEGFVWGRGAMDMKGSLIAALEAAEQLILSGYRPARTIYFAFGHDEEIGGAKGAAVMARHLESKGVSLGYVLDEGGAIVEGVIPGVADPVAAVGIAEKGYVSLSLKASAPGGHSMSPPRETAIAILSAAVRNVETKPLPTRLTPVTAQMLEHLGPEMKWHKQLVLANLWLFQPLVLMSLEASPSTNAMVRTTAVTTVLRAGATENSLPQEAEATVNVRVLPGDSIDQTVRLLVDRIGDDRVRVQVNRRDEPSRISDVQSQGFKVVAASIRDVWPGAVVVPSQSPGGSDSRHYAHLAKNVFRFVPLNMTREDFERIHGTNERIGVLDYKNFILFYRSFLERASSA